MMLVTEITIRKIIHHATYISSLLLEVNTLTIVESGSIASKHFCYKEIKGKLLHKSHCYFQITIKTNSRQLLFLWGKHQMKLRNYLLLAFSNIFTQIIPTSVMPTIHQSCKRKHYSSCIMMRKLRPNGHATHLLSYGSGMTERAIIMPI